MWQFMKDKIKVVEVFHSIEGEGKRAGQLVNFVRLAGCNLRCSYCDTSYATSRNDGEWWNIEELADRASYGSRRVTLTGGEPLLQDNAMVLIDAMLNRELEINIETNGTIPLDMVIAKFGAGSSFVTMDVKSPSSGMKRFNRIGNLNILRPNDVVKFVVGSKEDLAYMDDVMRPFEFNPKFHWYISPVWGQIDMQDIVQHMKEHRYWNAKIQVQMHKIIWNPEQRGV